MRSFFSLYSLRRTLDLLIQIDTISYTFENPSPTLPYPAGYRHDLSLTTDDDLPELVSPQGYPVLSEWASYSAALAGSDVYAVRMNTVVGRWLLLSQGTIDQNAIRNATVQNTYGIGRIDLKSASLVLWTTTESLAPAVGSGTSSH